MIRVLNIFLCAHWPFVLTYLKRLFNTVVHLLIGLFKFLDHYIFYLKSKYLNIYLVGLMSGQDFCLFTLLTMETTLSMLHLQAQSCLIFSRT
jgi:hypothetical protein